MEIFAHRILFNGIENNIDAIPHFNKLGIGIELDLRFGKNGVYISHDKTKDGISFESACKICQNTNIRMALHIKEVDVMENVIKLLKKYRLKNYFLFDTENFNLQNKIDEKKVASYITKKQDQKNTYILWCDEIGEKWFTKKSILELQKNNKIIYGMSLEIVKTCNEHEIVEEWRRLIDLGLDGVCTKYPEKFNSLLKEGVLN